MAEQQMIALAQVTIKGAGSYVDLLSLEISTEGNRHASMTVTLRLETDAAGTTGKDRSGSRIQAETSDGTCLFTGECIYSRSNEMALYEEITLYVVSESYQADIVRNSRTLQNASKTLAGVAEEILKDYGAVVIIDKDMALPNILVQEQETDWEFLVRIANQYGYQVYTDPAREKMYVSLGSAGGSVNEFWNGASLSNATINLQESRLKAANQGEQAGTYHYASEGNLTYNPLGAAGKKADGKVITSSHISSDKGVLVNYVSSAMAEDLMTDSQSMMAETSSSHVLSGTVLSVNATTMKVQFDIDSEQSESEAMELPYENTISNSFYCMPEEGDKVYGYIDNRGTAIILGCKRKDTADTFYEKPDEKAITVLDNMIHFTANNLELTANREPADQNEDSRISILLDSEQGMDIHGSGKIIVYSDKQVGLMAGNTPADPDKLLQQYNHAAEAGKNKYQADGGMPLEKDAWYEEMGTQAGKSFVEFFKAVTAYELRRDIGHYFSKDEFETQSEQFAEGTIYLGGEKIVLNVGNTIIQLGAGEGENVSSIYLQADLFKWLGFNKASGYEKVEQAYSDGFTTFLDVLSIALDIASMVAMCVCPVAGIILMGANAALSLTRGDYCGALLSCIPMAQEVKLGGKLIAAFPKFVKVIKVIGVACKYIDKAGGIMAMFNQGYSVIKKIATGEMTWEDAGMLALTALSVFVNSKTDKYRSTHGSENNGLPDGGNHPDGVDGPDRPSSIEGGNHPDGVDGPDRPGNIDGGNHPDGVDGPNRPGNVDGEGSPKRPSNVDGEGSPKRPGNVDGEGSPKRPGNVDGEGGSKRPGSADGEGGKKRPGDADGGKHPDGPENHNSSDIDAETNQNHDTGADPVDVVTGALTEQHTDLRLKDICGDYRVVRTYRSTRKNTGRMLGSRWMFQFEVSLWRSADQISVYLPDAHKEQFIKTDGSWHNQINGKEKYRLSEQIDGYELMDLETCHSYHFDIGGQIRVICDAYGNRTSYAYTGRLLSSITLESGISLYLTYEGERLSLLKDSQGREYYYRYEGDLLTEVTYPNGGTITYEYTREGYLTRIHNENGKCYVTSHYDRKGRVVRQETADGEEYIFFYDDAAKENTLTTTGLNRTVKYCYNRRKLVEKTVYGDGTTEEKRYDDNEKVLWEKDRLGHETSRVFDAYGRMLKETKPSGLCTLYQYDEKGNCTGQEDNAGRKIRYGYDAQGTLTSAAFQTEDGRWAKTCYERDSHGRIVRQVYPDGSEKCWQYGQPFSHPTSYRGAEGEYYHYELDEFGRKMIVHGPEGDVYYGYNTNHFLSMVRDEEGNCIRYQYDRTGNRTGILRPEDVEAEDGRKIGFMYDLMDHLTGMEDAEGIRYRRLVNSEGKTIRLIPPGAGSANDGLQRSEEEGTAYTYDEDGRQTHVRYPDGGVLRRFYDACGNLIKQVEPEDYDEKTDDGPGMTYAYDEMNRLVSETDRTGLMVRKFTYDLAGRIRKVSTAKELASGSDIGTLYRYNHAGWMTEKRVPVRVEDKEVRYRLTAYQYDIRGRLTIEKRYLDEQGISSASGRVLMISRNYDKNGRLVKVTDSQGACMEYRYDTSGRRTAERSRIREGVYQEQRYTYTATGRLASVTANAGAKITGRSKAVTSYGYDRNGNLTRIVTPLGHEIRREYDRAGKLLGEEHIQKDGKIHNTVRYLYDGSGRLCETRRKGAHYFYGYDCRGRRNLVRDGNGRAMAYVYDKNSRLVNMIHPKQYRTAGCEGAGTRYTYQDGRLAAVYRPDGGLEKEYRYNAYGEPEEVLDGAGGRLYLSYDLAGRRTHARTAEGAEQEITYDAWGNRVSVTDGNGNTTRFRYDGWGKATEVQRADGGVERYGYDEAGNLIEACDGNGNTTRFRYNSINRLESRTDQAGESEFYEYDAEGRPCRYTDRNGNETVFEYNMYGSLTRRRHIGNRNGGNQSIGNRISRDQSTANENCTNQHTGTQFTEGLLSTEDTDVFSVLENEGKAGADISWEESYGYTPEGRLSYAIGGGMRYDYLYDEAGRLSEKRASGRTLLSYEYNEDGRLSAQTDLTGKRTVYRYNEWGILEAVEDEGILQASYAYTPEGRIESITGGSLQNSYQYDPDGNLTGLRTLLGGDLLADNRYLYDKNGNCTGKETLSGRSSYEYDSRNRIVEAAYPWGRETFSYDLADNRTGREFFERMDGETERLAKRERYEYDERNRLVRSIIESGAVQPGTDSTGMTGTETAGMPGGYGADTGMPEIHTGIVKATETPGMVSGRNLSFMPEGVQIGVSGECSIGFQQEITDYEYDSQGNLLKDGTASYSYDSFNRLVKAETFSGESQVNRYDAEGLRHEMEENGKLVQFLYRGRDVVAETTEDGSIIRYIRGNRLISSDNEKARCYYHYASDEMGSITHIIKDAVKRKLAEERSALDMDGAAQDETGQSVSRACVVNRYEYDAFGNTVTCEETVPNRFRFAGEQYDQITQQYYLRARFYNPVIGRLLQEDDYYGDGLNLYAYCRNNPVSYVDPSGHGTESAPDKKPDNNPKDLQDMVDDINNGSGASPSDMEAIKSLAEEFGLDPSEFDVKSSKEVNQQALKDLVAEVNKAGGADPSDQRILKEFAEEYGMDYDSLGVEEAGGGSNAGSSVTLNHQATSGADLTSTPGKTTTVLGRYGSDTGEIINELGIPKNTDFSGNPGGFNLLNTPDELYAQLGADGFWDEYNKPFLDAAISRGDEIIMATPITNSNLYLPGSMELTGYGREYFYLLDHGYKYVNGKMILEK